MLEFKTTTKTGDIVLKLPTSLSEITPEYLKGITAQVAIADNYSLIAVCYKEKLSNIILSVKQKKNDISAAVVPVFVKAGATDSNFINWIEAGTKVIVAPSQLAMGHHVACPNNPFTISNVVNATKDDGFAYQHALQHSEYCYFVEFKLIPNCEIHGYYDSKVKGSFENPFTLEATVAGA